MPELPEVETVKRGLEGRIVGKTVVKVDFDWPKGFPNAPGDVEAFLLGASITQIQRRGKALIIEISTGYALVIHLKMTGQLVFVAANQSDRFGAGHPNESLVAKLPDTSTRVVLDFSDGSKLYFNDQRKFGWMRLMPILAVEDLPFFQKLGPEPMASSTTNAMLRARFTNRKNSMIKAALLDQSVLAGVGNIYADEALWGAKIHPRTRVGQLSNSELNTLFTELRSIMEQAIASGGSTDKNYVNADGQKGSYLQIARVFRREGQLCKRCQTTIEKIRIVSRGTHICSACQKERL